MHTVLHIPNPAQPRISAAASVRTTLLHALRAALSAWQRRRMKLAALRSLQGLDAHALRDLGLDRSELTSLVHHARDLTRARAGWSC